MTTTAITTPVQIDTSAQVLFGANDKRQGIVIANDSDGFFLVRLSEKVPTVDKYSFAVAPGKTHFLSLADLPYTGAITFLWRNVNTGKAMATEITCP